VHFSNFDLQSRFSVHQSQPEEITLREDCRSVPFVLDDGFGESLVLTLSENIWDNTHSELSLIMRVRLRGTTCPSPSTERHLRQPSSDNLPNFYSLRLLTLLTRDVLY